MSGRTRIRAVVLAATATLLFAGTASADKPDEKKRKPRQVVDTGVELLPADPTADAMLERMTSRSSAGLTVVQHDNGMLSVDLEGRFMNVMVAKPSADGSAVLSCHTDSHAVKAASAAEPVAAWSAKAKARRAQPLEEK